MMRIYHEVLGALARISSTGHIVLIGLFGKLAPEKNLKPDQSAKGLQTEHQLSFTSQLGPFTQCNILARPICMESLHLLNVPEIKDLSEKKMAPFFFTIVKGVTGTIHTLPFYEMLTNSNTNRQCVYPI